MSKVILHSIEPHRFAPAPFNKEGCWFRYSYYARPWVFVRDAWYEAGSLIHRALYGWSVADTWSMDHYLSTIIPPMLRRLKTDAHGVPTWCIDADSPLQFGTYTASEENDVDKGAERWDDWLEKKAQAFEMYQQLMEDFVSNDDPRWQQFWDEFADLGRRFYSLWD